MTLPITTPPTAITLMTSAPRQSRAVAMDSTVAADNSFSMARVMASML
jgi:hypothetical protein